MKYAIGVDVGGTTIKFGLFNQEGEILGKSSIATPASEGAEAILTAIAEHVKKILNDSIVGLEDLAGIGVGIPGPILKRDYVITCANIDCAGVYVGTELQKRIGARVLVANDANVAALGEQWLGAGRGVSSLVMFTLGTGVGGGIVIDGKIHEGVCGAGGEIGHMPILKDPCGRTCGCGQKYCLELVASATGIIARTKEAIASGERSTLESKLESMNAKDVFDAAAEGDALAQRIVEKTGDYLGRACAQIAAVLNPEMFVFGGGVSHAGEAIREPIERYFTKYCYEPARQTCTVRLAQLGNDAGIIGAARLVM